MEKNQFKNLIQRHAHMLFDFERTLPLIKAIQKKISPGDIVIDLGCGLGFLSFTALHAGAKYVYAIDIDPHAIDYATWQAKKLGLSKRICFFNDHSYHVELPRKADLLIQETIGELAFDENFLPTLQDAKKRLLKPKGKIIPEKICLMGVPIDKNHEFIGSPDCLIQLQTQTTLQTKISLQKKWRFRKPVSLLGILLWPKIQWAKNLKTDCSPLQPLTHWGQTLLKVPKKKKVTSQIEFLLQIAPHPESPSNYTETSWKIT